MDRVSYSRGIGVLPRVTSTDAFAQALDPYAWHGTPGVLYSAYGWGPGSFVGMPLSYSYHVGYDQVPLGGSWNGSWHPNTEDSG